MIRTVSSREVYRNAWMSVREDDIRRPDGSEGVYGVVDKPDYALVIPGTRTAPCIWSSSTATPSRAATGSSRRAPGPPDTRARHRSNWPAPSCARRPGCGPPG